MRCKDQKRDITGYLAVQDRVEDVLTELGFSEKDRKTAERNGQIKIHDHLIFVEDLPRPSLWSQNIWLNPRILQVKSISDAAEQLKSIQRNWVLHSVTEHRRAKLIQAKLPKIKNEPLRFLEQPKTQIIGSWTLLDKTTLIASPECSSQFPNGEVQFCEDKKIPPNRAYLKLWELFTLRQRYPQKNARCLDLGSSPGGWTWVLQTLGACVISVDKAPLEPRIARLPNIEFRKQSAFSIEPKDLGPIDWLFSDIICYPERLYKYLQRWLGSGLCQNYVCTLKFQGKTDVKTIESFASIEGGKLLHLSNNKHELTWVKFA